MPLRNARPITFRPMGLSDATDGSNAPDGAMASLQNLIPSLTTRGQFVPRAAATQSASFNSNNDILDQSGGDILDSSSGPIQDSSGFTSPGAISALITVGTRAYGMIASGLNPGHDQPFCYDLAAGVFVPIAGIVLANLPTTPAATGDWIPPTIAMIGGRLMITHPGYDGLTNFVGWLDMRGFSTAAVAITGTTHGSNLIDGLSLNPLQLGVQVGDLVGSSAGDVPNGVTVAALTATSVTLSQPATGSNPGVNLIFASGTLAKPLYGAGQMNASPFPSVPRAVANFNNRAYYAVGNGLQFSDALEPLQQTNASQAFTLGDTTPVTALAGLPLGNQIIGGVVQALMVFKGIGVLWQITGDAALNTLAANAIAGSVGTAAPNTIAATPQGLAYIAPDGLRVIDQAAQVSPPIGADGDGVAAPFVNAVSPSRMCAAYNQNVYRVSVQNGAVNGQPVQEYWLHMNRGVWTGPHTFPAALVAPYDDGGKATFVMAPSGIAASLWQSDAAPSLGSTYTENGNPLSFAYQPSLLPDNQVMAKNCIIESAMGFALPNGASINVLASDEQGAPLATVTISAGQAGQGSVWDAFTWGQADWGVGQLAYQQYDIPWPNEIVFKQASVRVSGQAAAGVALGNLYLRYQVLGFLGV